MTQQDPTAFLGRAPLALFMALNLVVPSMAQGSSPGQGALARDAGLTLEGEDEGARGHVEAQASASPGQGRRVLFIRGASGTAGFLGGGGDEYLSDIHDTSSAPGNHGWGELRSLLESEGFHVDQVIEGQATPGLEHIDFDAVGTNQYSVVVMGSNNGSYVSPKSEGLLRFLEAGGGVLFIHEGNFGSAWFDAAGSDQPFVEHAGMRACQEFGSYVLRRADGDFVVGGVDMGNHPILIGPDGALGTADDVNEFEGFGVSPTTIENLVPGAQALVLAQAEGLVRENAGPGKGPGTLRPATARDGALLVASVGAGRLASHFDANTFFNNNGEGTSIDELDHRQYASNLFAWLAGPTWNPYGSGKPNSLGQVARMSLLGEPSLALGSVPVFTFGGVPNSPGFVVRGPNPGTLPFAGGTLLVGVPFGRRTPIVLDVMGSMIHFETIAPALVGHVQYYQTIYDDPLDPGGFQVGLSGGLRVQFVP